MASSWISVIFACGDVGMLSLELSRLTTPDTTPIDRRGTLKLMDTFDWSLDRSAITLLFHESASNTEVTLLAPSATLLLELPFTNTPWTSVDHLEQPVLSRELSRVVADRALIVQAATPAESHLFQYHDAQGMPTTNVWLYELPEIKKCAILLATRRGYKSFGKKIRRQVLQTLTRLEIEPEVADPFDLILRMRRRAKRDYQSKFVLEMDPSTQGCITLGQALNSEQQRAARNAPWIKDHPDPEFLHDLRVAMRRAASLIKALDPILHPIDASWFRTELKYFISATSPVRDLENLGSTVAGLAKAEPQESELRTLSSSINEGILRSYDELSTLISSPRFEHLMANWARLSRRCLSLSLEPAFSTDLAAFQTEQPSEGPVHPRTSVADSAEILLTRSASSLIKKAKKAKREMMPESLHRLRKEAKAFRYLLEFYEPILEPTAARRCIAGTKKLQDALGRHQDCVVQIDLLGSLCEKYQIPKDKVEPVFMFLRNEQQAAIESYAQEIKLFSGPSLFREIQLATGHRRK
jgi:CHAD domain-containing protein